VQPLVPALPDGAHTTCRELAAEPIAPADTDIGVRHGKVLSREGS
jgi:hypothetical protein